MHMYPPPRMVFDVSCYKHNAHVTAVRHAGAQLSYTHAHTVA